MEIFKHISSELFSVISGAIIGAFKLLSETKRDKSTTTVIVNFFIGLFVGITLGLHYSSNTGALLAGLIALVGGAVGALAIDSIIQMFPNLFKRILNKYLGK